MARPRDLPAEGEALDSEEVMAVRLGKLQAQSSKPQINAKLQVPKNKQSNRGKTFVQAHCSDSVGVWKFLLNFEL
jgi:hypothetical protein